MEKLGKNLWESINTAVGKMISTYLSNKEDLDDRTIHFLFSANHWEKIFQKTAMLGRSILKLKVGTSLIVDHYSYSSVSFSTAKGLDLSWCKELEVGLPTPYIVLYLEKTPEIAAKHGDYGGKRYE